MCVCVFFAKSLMQSKRSKKLEESAHFFVGNEKRADGQQKKRRKKDGCSRNSSWSIDFWRVSDRSLLFDGFLLCRLNCSCSWRTICCSGVYVSDRNHRWNQQHRAPRVRHACVPCDPPLRKLILMDSKLHLFYLVRGEFQTGDWFYYSLPLVNVWSNW